MADRGWANRVRDLEAQGKLAEARELMAAHVGPEGHRALLRATEAVQQVMWPELPELAAQLEAAKALPDGDDRKQTWLSVEDAPFERISRWWHLGRLPDLLRRGKGRPPGSTIATPENLSEFEGRLAAGQTQKSAAQAVFEGMPGAESKAENLIKYWRKHRRLMGQ